MSANETGVSALRARVRGLADAMRTQLWPVPTIGILLALAGGIGLPRLDAHLDATLSATVSVYLFGGGPSAARTLLGAVAGSLITVTALTFSLTVLTLQLASSQFSPRLLRTFTRDRFVHFTLAVFLGTFVYALTVLRTVRDADSGHAAIVPQLSVTVAFVLCILSVAALVFFLAHLVAEIRVETMLSKVHDDAARTLQGLAPQRDPEAISERAAAPAAPVGAATVSATTSGFLVDLDERALLAAAEEADAVVWIECAAGCALVAGTPVGSAWVREGALDGDRLKRLQHEIGAALTTASERTPGQDVGYGLRQLTDVAVKALSPGINDPTTAIHALGHSSALLCQLAVRELGPHVVRSSGEQVRVVLQRPAFGELLDRAVTQPRRYGASDPFVVGRLFGLLREVAWSAPDTERRQEVCDQLARLRDTVATQQFDHVERQRMANLGLLVEHALEGVWVSRPGSPVDA